MCKIKGAVTGAVGGGLFHRPMIKCLFHNRKNTITAPTAPWGGYCGAIPSFFTSGNKDLTTAPRARARRPSYGGEGGPRLAGGTAPSLLSDQRNNHAQL